MNKLNQTEYVVFKIGMLYIQRVSIQIIHIYLQFSPQLTNIFKFVISEQNDYLTIQKDSALTGYFNKLYFRRHAKHQ